MKKSILSYDNFRGGSAWFLLLLGIALYCCGYFWMPNDSIWKEVVVKIADVLVIGVIIGYLSNAAQFLGVFKQDLQDIIYGKEFIKNRNDIDVVWENVTKQLFKNKFPALQKDLLNIISDYLPKDEVSYYNDYETHTTIEWVDRKIGIIKATDNIEFELIADNSSRFTYPIKNWVRVPDGKSSSNWYKNELTNITVNDKAPTLGEQMKTKEGDVFCEIQEIILEGCSKYSIRFTRVRQYSIFDDYYIGFRSHYIVNKMRVCLDAPDDIEVLFTCRGTTKDFDDVPQKGRRIEKKYKGLILPRQGYLFMLRKIENKV